MPTGIHHVTAISGPARRNADFYTRVLGLRLVKKTVNFDDPGTYHLYYGDRDGSPGTILTFFPWDHASSGRPGNGEAVETSFRIPKTSIPFWAGRLREHAVAVQPLVRRFDDPVLSFADPDGTRLALVGVEDEGSTHSWEAGGIDLENAVRGFHGVTLLVADAPPTAAVLTDALGFDPGPTDGSTARYVAPGTWVGGVVDLRVTSGLPRGRLGAGSVHHVAFRAANDAAQAAMVERLTGDHKLAVTDQRDRYYFRSVYFREPGGVLFEIATDIPGFAIDEAQATLGAALKLPGFLEARRPQIEATLPELV